MKLPQGVIINYLKSHSDERRIFTELFRESWINNTEYLQWNFVSSNAGVFRRVRLHKKHFDYLSRIKRRAIFGLHDIKKFFNFSIMCNG